MQRIAIVDPIDATREPLRNLLLGIDSVWLEAECARYEFFPDVIQQSSPDVAIVSLDADRAKAIQLVTQIAADSPDLPILVVSSDHQSILQALQRGAKFFLTQPVVLEELLAALRRVPPRGATAAFGKETAAATKSCQVIAVLGSRGGIGCTTVAVNLGCDLARHETNNVALVDLDLALGDADVVLDPSPDHTLADVAMNIERLDMTFLRRSLVRHEGTGLSLLAHPVQMQDIGLIHEEHLQRVLNLLKASYTHLILDLSKGLTPTDLMALRIADIILLVAQLELSSIRNVVRMLLTLGAEEGLTDKIRIVMNRVGADNVEGEISLQKAEETIGKPIFWQIPNDARAVISARNNGVPLILHAPKSKAHLSILGLADALSPKDKDHNGPPAKEKPKKKAGWFR
ncbi:MAG: AAA family ATPase [Gemmataceae bacterium]|nr:AAA family ATPase [Gemmataceae bacterium]MDW8266437.1 AAA family ATPase [Gemmataceae bacterium]